jgi:hypothetical protein
VITYYLGPGRTINHKTMDHIFLFHVGGVGTLKMYPVNLILFIGISIFL